MNKLVQGGTGGKSIKDDDGESGSQGAVESSRYCQAESTRCQSRHAEGGRGARKGKHKAGGESPGQGCGRKDGTGE